MTDPTGSHECPGRVPRAAEYANTRVLIVDDQREIHDDFVEMLNPTDAEPDAGGDLAVAFAAAESAEPARSLPRFQLLHASTGEDACEIIRRAKADKLPIAVAYVDVRMPPGIDGVETIRRVRRVDRDVEIVIMTAYTDRSLPDIVHDMELLHKLLYIRKPFIHEEIQQITVALAGKWNIERELAEKQRELAGSHRRLESVLDATGDAMAMLDGEGRLVFANAAWEKVMDLQAEEVESLAPAALAARCEERFREPDLGDLAGRFRLDRGNVVETTGAGELPEHRLFYRSVAPVLDSDGKAIGSLFVYRDVSKEIEAEQMKAEVLRLRSALETTYSFEGVVGTSTGMQHVYALIKQAAESDITVLVRGESGTGKELVARSFHSNSLRKDGPFVAVDCASIPEALIESELFGHERGAFTGATTRHIGAFERAHGGTILLDEIGDMPHALQAKLLRVLQERRIRRVGGSIDIPVDIRVITATNKDLERAVQTAEFREDLFYRISAFPVVIPPLSERREDTPLLAQYFLQKHAARADKHITGFSAATLHLLLRYDWPGNVRELENTIQRAVLLETGTVLQVGCLPPRLLSDIAAPGTRNTLDAILPLAEVERQALVRTLEYADRNITRAALALGISRATLHRKLRKYELNRD